MCEKCTISKNNNALFIIYIPLQLRRFIHLEFCHVIIIIIFLPHLNARSSIRVERFIENVSRIYAGNKGRR